jgi:hypothetical protein
MLVVDQTKVLQAAADQKGEPHRTTNTSKRMCSEWLNSSGARLVVFSNAEVGSWEALELEQRAFLTASGSIQPPLPSEPSMSIPEKSNGAERLSRLNASAILKTV